MFVFQSKIQSKETPDFAMQLMGILFTDHFRCMVKNENKVENTPNYNHLLRIHDWNKVNMSDTRIVFLWKCQHTSSTSAVLIRQVY